MYLRGLPAFANGLPYQGNKLRYIGRDLLRCAEHERVVLRFPSVFPVNGIHALRGALFAEEQGRFAAYHEAMFAAAWRDDRNISDKQVALEVGVEAGLDRAALAAALD